VVYISLLDVYSWWNVISISVLTCGGGVSESKEPIKGEFAKKLIEEVQRILKLKKEGNDLHFKNEERETYHNIIIEDDI
jgi:hypothetical protein